MGRAPPSKRTGRWGAVALSRLIAASIAFLLIVQPNAKGGTAQITIADLKPLGGVVHLVDTVLMPS